MKAKKAIISVLLALTLVVTTAGCASFNERVKEVGTAAAIGGLAGGALGAAAGFAFGALEVGAVTGAAFGSAICAGAAALRDKDSFGPANAN